jgi:molecular chaperone GrpE
MAEKTGAEDPGSEIVEPVEPEEPEVSAEGAPAEEPAAEDVSIEGLTRRLEEAAAAVATADDRALRAAAETENVRRRAARDVEHAHKFALEKFTADLLPVLDSLEKAVQSAHTAATEETASASAIAEGVELSVKLFLDVLGKTGIDQIDPLGEPFDPQHHQAIATIENPDSEPNSVLEVMQKGYTLNGRLVRAAMVLVSKGP